MLYLRDASFVDWRTLRMRRGHLEIGQGPLGKIRFIPRIPRGEKALDCSGRLVTKSFVIAHHHLYSALACGMPGPARAPKNFPDMLKLTQNGTFTVPRSRSIENGLIVKLGSYERTIEL